MVDVNLASGNFEESPLVVFQFFELLLDDGYTSLMAYAFSDLTKTRGQSPSFFTKYRKITGIDHAHDLKIL